MNTACIPLSYYNPFFVPAVRGISETAVNLHKAINRMLRDCSRSLIFDELEILQALNETLEEYSIDNWDGYGAKALNMNSFNNAQRFALALPTTIPLPEVSVDPDGEIAFEWYKGPRRVFSVSIGIHNEINYAGLFGLNKANGTEYYFDEIPKAILDNLERLLSF